MKIVKIRTTKRLATPDIVNAYCECGGLFRRTLPFTCDPTTSSISHTCANCGRIVNFLTEYPAMTYYSDAPEESHEHIDGIVDVDNSLIVKNPNDGGKFSYEK